VIPWAHHIYQSLSRRDYTEPWADLVSLLSLRIRQPPQSNRQYKFISDALGHLTLANAARLSFVLNPNNGYKTLSSPPMVYQRIVISLLRTLGLYSVYKLLRLLYNNLTSPLRVLPGPPSAGILYGNQKQIWETVRSNLVMSHTL